MKSLRPLFALGVFLFLVVGTGFGAAARPNILFITMDDMSCDSVGVYGCKLPGTTSNMDRLATQSLRFKYAHSQVGNCMPTRNVIASGRYPHNNRVEGFYEIKNPGYQTLSDFMKAGGYFTGIRGKVAHATPYTPYPGWDVVLDTVSGGGPAQPKNVASYYESAKQGMALAKKAGKPFCLNINISDPHKPFWNEDGHPEVNKPSRVFTAAEVPVPGFLPDDPGIREELALYYSSVRRGDDCLGEVLRALKESGEDERTAIIFLSDHGMPLPFAKTQLYFHSTRTPWMVRWPGVTKAGTVDDRHLISFVDLLPTMLEIAAVPLPAGLDGRSIVPILRGERQENRDFVVTEYNENSGGHRHPMRSIVTKDFAYIFNPWSNGERVMATATKGTVSYRRLQALSRTDPKVAARLKLFDCRVPEEMYNYARDPDALDNLIAKPEFHAERERLEKQLEAWMVQTKDPMLEVFRNRQDPKAREAYMKMVEAEAAERNGTKAGKGGKAGKKKGKRVEDL
ncbi:MAG TPA: sulfatase [Opitutaceae bacterium]|nr:sulfatase [Opitutaceae bacterium]